MRYCLFLIMFIVAILAIVACNKILPSAVNDNEQLDGPVEGLSNEQNHLFLLGDEAFNDEIFTRETGLGPLFVATSCASCHAGDGKGHPFTTLTRFGQSDTLNGNLFLHAGGPQLQHLSIPGYQPEIIPPGVVFSRFVAPGNTGLGLLDAVSDTAILKHADPYDSDGDGISGRVNWVYKPDYTTARFNSITNNGRYIGRFGKKAATYDLLQQTAVAYNQDIGITSIYEPYDTYSGQAIDPEINTQKLLHVLFYLKTLKAPIPRDSQEPAVNSGAKLFFSTGCVQCHTPQLQTGPSAISALAYKDFFPYTDLLLHDMGPVLNDGYTEGTALPEEWRTPPLWGLGLAPKSQGGQYFLLHDGRAHTIEQAIELHGGEGQKAADNYRKLSATEKRALIRFLESL